MFDKFKLFYGAFVYCFSTYAILTDDLFRIFHIRHSNATEKENKATIRWIVATVNSVFQTNIFSDVKMWCRHSSSTISWIVYCIRTICFKNFASNLMKTDDFHSSLMDFDSLGQTILKTNERKTVANAHLAANQIEWTQTETQTYIYRETIKIRDNFWIVAFSSVLVKWKIMFTAIKMQFHSII